MCCPGCLESLHSSDPSASAPGSWDHRETLLHLCVHHPGPPQAEPGLWHWITSTLRPFYLLRQDLSCPGWHWAHDPPSEPPEQLGFQMCSTCSAVPIRCHSKPFPELRSPNSILLWFLRNFSILPWYLDVWSILHEFLQYHVRYRSSFSLCM